MKKIFCIIIAVSMLCCFLLSVFADDPGKISMSYTPIGNEEFEVLVNIQGEPDAAMLQFTVIYDSANLTCTAVTAGAALAGNGAPTINTKEGGKIYFVWDSLKELQTDGTILSMKFVRTNPDIDANVAFDFEDDFIIADANFAEHFVETNGIKIPLSSEKHLQDTQAREHKTTNNSLAGQSNSVTQGINQGLTLSQNSVTLKPGGTIQLSVAEKEQTVVWESSNESVAVVENGKVTAIAEGETIITAMGEDGVVQATCITLVTGASASKKRKITLAIVFAFLSIFTLSLCIFFEKRKGKEI